MAAVGKDVSVVGVQQIDLFDRSVSHLMYSQMMLLIFYSTWLENRESPNN